VSRVLAVASALAVGLAAALAPAAAHADDAVTACADAAERGQELRRAHRLVEARPELLRCAQRACPEVIRASCTDWLAELDRVTPTIVASVRDDRGRDVAGVAVSIDGASLPATVTATAVAANPGAHTMRYVAPGFEPLEHEVLLREGESLRVLEATLRRTAVSPSEATATLGPPSPAPDTRHARPLPTVPIVLASVSVVALSVFAYAGLSGAADYRRLERDCGPRCPSSDVDAVRGTFLVADVALVAAVLTGGTAAALWLLDGRARTAAAARR
jgi:hypothetical protein